MELKRAKEVLDDLHPVVLNECRLCIGLGTLSIDAYFSFKEVSIDGTITFDQLEAIATWMRDPEGVVKA